LIVDVENTPDEQDFVNVWLWFFHRHIVKTIYKQNLTVFKRNNVWEKYKACVSAPTFEGEDSFIHKFFPKIKRGKIEVGAEFSNISGNLGLDLEFADPEKTQVKFNYIVNKANELFSQLSPENGKLYIFLDELELSLTTTKLYSRDARMIRDVIVAMEKLNNISRDKHYQLYVIGAIRSEVLTAVSSLGKEINKTISDFGIPIYWHQSGGDIKTHPILRILIKRISSSENFYNYPELDFDQLWSKYFPARINNIPTPMYILNLTWYRPRDVIRLLTLAQKFFPTKTSFDQQVFESIRKQYSTESWTELSEELRTSFKSEEIEGIRRLFYGYKEEFSYEDITNHGKSLIEMYHEVELLLRDHSLGDILSRLYKIGFIGNAIDEWGKSRRYRVCHRGDDEILLEKNMFIHRGLRPYLSIG
jgi:hypothetical protein